MTHYLYFEDPTLWLRPETCYVLLDILKGVIRDPNGTGARFSDLLPHVELAGKTGTTNEYNDGWFVGASPKYTVGVWVGFDQESSLGPQEVGSRTAMPIWASIMKELHSDIKENLTFQKPESIKILPMDPNTGQINPPHRKVIWQALRPEDLERWEKQNATPSPDQNLQDEFE